MKNLILPALLALTLTACASDQRHYEPNYSGTLKHVHYACEDGTLLPVDFESRVAVVYFADDSKMILDQQPAASGYHYSSGHYQLRGKGRHAEWIAGAEAVRCRG